MLMVKSTKANVESERQIAEDKKQKAKLSDVTDTIPDSASIF